MSFIKACWKRRLFNLMSDDFPKIDKERVLDRLADIELAYKELEKFYKIELAEFTANKDNFPLASYWLRLAIEAVLTIGTHLLSRLPQNGKRKDYTQVIISLGDYEVIPKEFTEKIKGMAGYRNRLVHLYWQVKSDELLKIIKDNLNDFKEFDNYIREYLKSIMN